MHSQETVNAALLLASDGANACVISRLLGVPRTTVRDWLQGRLPRHIASRNQAATVCEKCGHRAHSYPDLPEVYVYLLGLYLGDGCLSEHRRDVFRLRVYLDLRYRSIIAECAAAIRSVMPGSKVHLLERRSNLVDRPEPSNVEVSSFSKAWPCLLPQHGPGRKHLRPIVLSEWQNALVRQHPGLLLRGLIHSDGWRFINTGTNWTCPRYSFSNRSNDIRRIFCDACDLLNLRYTFAPRTVYVSRMADVAVLDDLVGPKR